jgi:hypothetical protein
MAKKTKRTRKEWTKNDLRSLKQYSREKLSVKKISRLLKRTEGALRTKAHSRVLPWAIAGRLVPPLRPPRTVAAVAAGGHG